MQQAQSPLCDALVGLETKATKATKISILYYFFLCFHASLITRLQ